MLNKRLISDDGPWPKSCAEDPLAERHFEILGWAYYTRVDHEDAHDGTQKLGHYAVDAEARTEIEIGFSSYLVMPRDCFAKLVRLDFPASTGGGPIDHGEVNRLYSEARSAVLGGVEALLDIYHRAGGGMPADRVAIALDLARRFPGFADSTAEAGAAAIVNAMDDPVECPRCGAQHHVLADCPRCAALVDRRAALRAEREIA